MDDSLILWSLLAPAVCQPLCWAEAREAPHLKYGVGDKHSKKGMILKMWLKKWEVHRGGNFTSDGLRVQFKGAAYTTSGRRSGQEEGNAVRRTLG